MAYTDEYNLSQDVSFQGRIYVALIRSAMIVLQQPKADSGQLAAARRVLDAPERFVVPVTSIIVTSPKVAAVAPDGTAVSDTDLQTSVDAALLLLVR